MSQIRYDGDLEDAQGLRDRRTKEFTVDSLSPIPTLLPHGKEHTNNEHASLLCTSIFIVTVLENAFPHSWCQ